ncbi:MAG: hypothetical protein AB8B53_00335 [Flavobacteriales bacterium]
MEKQDLHIKEGITTRHLIKGLILAFVGIAPLAKGYVYVSVVVWYFAVCLILSVEGVYIDFKSRKIKRYTNFVFFKHGTWENLPAYNRVGISLYKAVNRRMTRTSYSTTKTQSFELFLENAAGDHEELLEHPDYEKILELAYRLAEGLELPLVNYYQEQRNAAMRRPRRR